MKPVNVFVNEQAMVSIIDLDSVQVTDRGHLLYPDKVCTPEYTPPEALNKPKTKKSSWDDFTLAVILYRLLVGIHPFAGSYSDPSIVEVTAAIKAGLYPHGHKRQSFKVVPPIHDRLREYPSILLELFHKAFVDGIFEPSLRPTAAEWFTGLNSILTAPPQIKSFTSNKDIVTDNSPVFLEWDVDNAISLQLIGFGDVSSLTGKEVQVIRNTNFVLEATSFTGNKVRSSLTVKVDQQPPEIESFSCSSFTISAGDTISLNWKTSRAETVIISPRIGNMPVNGNTTFKLNASTSFKLKATSFFGIESYGMVNIVVHPLPTISEFTISHSRSKPGKPVNLSWRCKDYQSVELFDGQTSQDVTGKNSIQVNPNSDTQYKLKVVGLAGLKEIESTVRVEVLSDTKIEEFKASRLITIQTVPTVLQWKVKNAKSIILEPGSLDVTGKDNFEVCPKVSTTYELVVKHELHESRKSIRIDVTPLPKFERSYIPTAPRLELKPPAKIWPVLPEFLSEITDPEDINKVFKTQILPGSFPFTGRLSRLFHQLRQIVYKKTN